MKNDWKLVLAINSSTGALLGAIFLICLGSELWGPFIPNYMRDLQAGILLIAAYGTLRDFLEAVNYLLGGWIAGRFNTRRGLLLFNATPLIGLLILLLWHSPVAVFVSVPFVFVWDSLAGPALLTVVGDSLPPDRRAMAFSLQSLLRRLSRVVAYALNALLVIVMGTTLGMHAAFGISISVVVISLILQFRYMKTASQDTHSIIHQPLSVLRGFDPQLKRLLAADIFARLAEGMPRELIPVFCVALFVQAAGVEPASAWALFGTMLIVSQVTSAITYLPMGQLASKAGFGKRPYIGWTFFFFASFPVILAAMGFLCLRGILPAGVVAWAMGLAFIVAGLREIGEPARKAMIVDLIPPDHKTQAIGIYWAARSVTVMLAPMAGGLVWVGVNTLAGHPAIDATGPGPLVMLLIASLCGAAGVAYYYTRFGLAGK